MEGFSNQLYIFLLQKCTTIMCVHKTLVERYRSASMRYKPIFHCDALGTGVGLDPQRHTFAVPNAKYINMLVYFDLTLECALALTPSPDASQWNIGGVGSSGIGHVYFMYISCIFHVVCASFSALATRKLADAKAVFSGIWAIDL